MALCGKSGYVVIESCTIKSLTGWSATLNKNVQTYNTYSGSGWQQTCTGNKAFTGTIEGKYTVTDDDIEAQLDTDNLVTLELHFNTGDYWSGEARLGTIEYGVNLETSEPQTWSCSFESDGTWTKTSA